MGKSEFKRVLHLRKCDSKSHNGEGAHSAKKKKTLVKQNMEELTCHGEIHHGQISIWAFLEWKDTPQHTNTEHWLVAVVS